MFDDLKNVQDFNILFLLSFICEYGVNIVGDCIEMYRPMLKTNSFEQELIFITSHVLLQRNLGFVIQSFWPSLFFFFTTRALGTYSNPKSFLIRFPICPNTNLIFLRSCNTKKFHSIGDVIMTVIGLKVLFNI